MFKVTIVEITKEVETKIYEQIVEELSISNVINAVNAIPPRMLYNPAKLVPANL